MGETWHPPPADRFTQAAHFLASFSKLWNLASGVKEEMGRRGTKPRPTEEHKQRGTYREDRHGGRLDETPTAGEPVMPPGLKAEGKQLWQRIVREHANRKILGEIDSAALFLCCRLWELLGAALRKAERCPTDKEIRASVTSYQAAFATWSARFGLTPADRANLRAARPAEGGGPESFDVPARVR